MAPSSGLWALLLARAILTTSGRLLRHAATLDYELGIGHEPHPRSAAVLIIGRSLENLTISNGSDVNLWRGGATVLDTMTGADEEDEDVYDPTTPEESPWASLLEHLLKPLKASVGGPVDVYVCTDSRRGEVPPEVTTVLEIEAPDQYTRAALCYAELTKPGKPRYDLYVKSRPDFVYLQDLALPQPYSAGSLYGRFREVQGISGLTSAHVSWSYCSGTCSARPLDAVGYTVDDMVLLAPRAVADRAFMSWEALLEAGRRFVRPAGWIQPSAVFVETTYTAGLLGAGVVAEPLAVVGYPARSRLPHRKWALRCSAAPVAKSRCGRLLPISEVNQALLGNVAEAVAAAAPRDGAGDR